MGGDPSAYAALGLGPDADAAAVDRAYKRLIKEHHPDREGGSATRAAELNRAYRDLRGPRAKDAIEFNEHPEQYRRRPVWPIAAGALGVGVVAGLVIAGPLGQWWPASAPNLPLIQGPAGPVAADAMNQPLNLPLIDAAAQDALQMS